MPSRRDHRQTLRPVERPTSGEELPAADERGATDAHRADDDLRHVRFLRWAAIALLMSWSAAGMVLLMTAC